MNRILLTLLLTLACFLPSTKEVPMCAESLVQERVEFPRPEPSRSGLTGLLYDRKSVRSFQDQALALDQISRLLFAAQGVNRPGGYRTVPSAGALYPLEIFVIAGKVRSLEPGVYRFHPGSHDIVLIKEGDKRRVAAEAALGQMWVAQAPAIFIISSVHDRVTGKYGRRGVIYAHIEAGCAAQSISLQAVELGLGTTVVGAFQESELQEIIGGSLNGVPLVLLPVGTPDR
ncbi:MAG: SagB/ThcOx family dehydrogenase [Desulfovibrionales bacterium]